MFSKLLEYRFTQLTLSALIVLGTLICIFTPNYYLFKIGSAFAVKIMLGYMVLSMVFLLLDQSRLMFTSIICCAGLCLFLKHSSSSEFKFPAQTSNEIVKFAHFNVSTTGDDYQTTIDTILQSDADIISIQEVTPDWAGELQHSLKNKYPHSKVVVRLDPYGLAIFSKYELRNIDTFHFEEIPNIVGSIRPYGFNQDIYFISTHTTPPLYSTALNKMTRHLDKLVNYLHAIHGPVITMGDLNAPPWWAEIQHLKTTADLKDSRRSSLNSLENVFQNPVDYILYSNHFDCIGFQQIYTPSTPHLGIVGTYQYKNNYFNADSAIQDF